MNPAQYTLEEIEMAYDAGYKVGLAKGEALRQEVKAMDALIAERAKVAKP